MKTSIKEIDKIMHGERIDKDGNKVIYRADIHTLPNGTFVLFNELPHVITGKQLLPWSAFGYDEGVAIPDGEVVVLTPRSVVNAFGSGYGVF